MTCFTIVAVWLVRLIRMWSALGNRAGDALVPSSWTVMDPSGRTLASCWPEKFVGYGVLAKARLCGAGEPPSFQVMAPVAMSIR